MRAGAPTPTPRQGGWVASVAVARLGPSAGSRWCFDCRRREPHGAELVPVAGKHDDAHAEGALCGVHGGQDELALGEVAAPGVVRAEAPVLGEGHGGGDDLPVDVFGFGSAEVGDQVSELGVAQDGVFAG